jgi:hypothetical protein
MAVNCSQFSVVEQKAGSMRQRPTSSIININGIHYLTLRSGSIHQPTHRTKQKTNMMVRNYDFQFEEESRFDSDMKCTN